MAPKIELPPGFRLEHLSETVSTNEDAHARAGEGAASGLLIWADRQSAGRGRRGRSWISERGNLYCSLLLRAPALQAQLEPGVAAQLSFAAALAVLEAIERRLPGCEVRLKWPNDVLVDQKKIAGMLLESRTAASGRLDWLVIGIGVNVASFPADCEFPATSLAAESASAKVADVLADVAAGLHRWISLWRAQGFSPIRERWLGSAWGLGGPISVRLADETLQGRFETLDLTGALVLSRADGRRQLIAAGDVFRS